MVAVRAPLTQEFEGLVTVSKAFCIAHHNTLPERFLRQPPSPNKNLAIVHACARRGLAKRFVDEARHLAAADASGAAAALDPLAVLTCGIHVLSGACKRGDADDVIAVLDRWPWPQQHVEGFKVRDTCFAFDMPHIPELADYDTWLEKDTRRVIGSHALCHIIRNGDDALLAALHADRCAGRLRANLARESSGLELHCAVQLRSELMLRLVLTWPGGVAKLMHPTTLSLATATLPLDTLRPLLNGMAWPLCDVYQAKALSGASSEGRADVVKLLLQPPYLAKANACQSLALMDAVKDNRVEVVELLLAAEPAAHADAQESNALLWATTHHQGVHWAEYQPHRAIAELLLAQEHHPAHADAQNSAALVLAVLQRDVAMAELLLSQPEHPARADAQDSRALILALEQGDIAMAALLLSQPEHPAHADARSSDALVLAVERGSTAMAELLLSQPEHPARADAQDSKALVLAAEKGDMAMAELLLSQELHPARADATRSRGLFLAVKGGHMAMAELLLSREHHPARADDEGSNALFAAAERGDSAMAHLLLSQAQNPARASEQGLLAVARHNQEMYNLLLSWIRRQKTKYCAKFGIRCILCNGYGCKPRR